MINVRMKVNSSKLSVSNNGCYAASHSPQMSVEVTLVQQTPTVNMFGRSVYYTCTEKTSVEINRTSVYISLSCDQKYSALYLRHSKQVIRLNGIPSDLEFVFDYVQHVLRMNSNVRTQVGVFQQDGFVMEIMIVETCLMNRTAVTGFTCCLFVF